MTNVFIIHGSYGNPEENWFPWLKEELEKLGHQVFVPRFPTPKNQSLENWLHVFKQYENELDEDSIVVGHSLGPAFLLSVLEKAEKKIKAAFFVAPFVSFLGNGTFDRVNKTFYNKFNWGKIKQNCKKFYIFHSDSDPYVPIEKAEEVAEELNTQIILVEGAGHFNEETGYKKFDFLLEKIKKEI